MSKKGYTFKGAVSAGMSVDLLMKSADIVKDICQPPMEMQRIILRHIEAMLDKRSKGVAQAIRFQVEHIGADKIDWLQFADLVERGLEIDYERKDSSNAASKPSEETK